MISSGTAICGGSAIAAISPIIRAEEKQISVALGRVFILNSIDFKYIQTGKPAQNAYIERFSRSYREGVTDSFLFDNLDEVREATALWVADYNNLRPHEALGNLPPVAYKEAERRTEGNTFPPLHSRGESFEQIKLNKL